MGKATGLSSQFRGKVGNVIGYLTKNRAGKYEQIVKGYQPVVANPQSYAQALARVPVGPVQRVCSALLPLVQRGFEGIAYGDASKSEFLSYNLKNFRGPYMVKGSVVVPPGPMLISRGQLQPVLFTRWAPDSDVSVAYSNLRIALIDDYPSKGELSATLLEKNSWLQRGEQLTLVAVTLSGGEYTYGYESFFLDPTDTTGFRGVMQMVTASGGYLSIDSSMLEELPQLVAVAFIRSQAYGLQSFKRSTATLSLNPDVYLYNDQTAVDDAVASYRTGEAPEDWENDPTPQYQQLAYLCMVDVTEDMIVTEISPAYSGVKCLGYVTKGGEFGIFYKYFTAWNSNCLLNDKAEILLGEESGLSRPYRFKGSYVPAREYSTIYGTL